ncbi:MAG: radical SAM protein [Desulfobacterales bacterium]|jgi:putative pyruvate formate lyase activating enzyme|nr:radical SAM protein [Desulfobacterales bacterium]
MDRFIPAYIAAKDNGRLLKKISQARSILGSCVLCPRQCKVDRLSDEKGICRTGRLALVSSYNPHFGEEAPLVGRHGSGTIFFTHCNLLCNFCQNYDISHEGWGNEVSDDELASIMISLQDKGCHNINFVTPTHVVPQILSALNIAIEKGLHIPLVYNSSGYDSVAALKLLDGIFDIYMPDFKFWDSRIAESTCDAADYPQIARQALVEMHRQVGDLATDSSGIAQRGLLVRHLVLPENLAGTREIMRFIRTSITPGTYVNIMSQYRPCGTAQTTPGLSRSITVEEFRAAIVAAKEEGISRLDRNR